MMTRLQRLKLYYRGPVEPDVYLNQEESTWWATVAVPIRLRTFVQAVVAVSLGMLAGRALMGIVALATGTVVAGRTSHISLVFSGIMGGFAALLGWNTLLTAKQKEMVRSRRLRAAMKLDEDP